MTKQEIDEKREEKIEEAAAVKAKRSRYESEVNTLALHIEKYSLQKRQQVRQRMNYLIEQVNELRKKENKLDEEILELARKSLEKGFKNTD